LDGAVGRSSRRTLARGVFLVLALLAAFGVSAPPGEAACAAPSTSIDVGRIEPGDVIEVSGEYWGTECNDTGSCTSGCFWQESCTGLEPSPPATDIVLELVPAGRTPGEREVLTEGVAADDALAFAVKVTLPDDLEPGRYRIVGVSATAIGPGSPTEPFRVD
jgi:hypothetical protein